MQEGSGVTNLQIELNYLDSVKSYCNSSDLGFLGSGGGAGGWGYLGWSTIVYMSSGMFRGKESLNRIKISWLVQDLLNFGVLGSLQLWGGGRWWGVSGGMGCLHTCAHMHMHAHACTHMHRHVYTYRDCKWLPPWRHPCLSCLQHACAFMCSHAYACMHGTAPNTPIPTPNPPTCHPSRVDPQNQLKFDNTWTNQDNLILFEDLKSVENSPPRGGCIVWWMGGFMGGLMGGVR